LAKIGQAHVHKPVRALRRLRLSKHLFEVWPPGGDAQLGRLPEPRAVADDALGPPPSAAGSDPLK
jgi:hypothetical protein